MDITLLQHVLAAGGWRSLFDAATLRRGVDYAHHGHVLSLKYREDRRGGVLTADVAGTKDMIYSVMIAISGTPGKFGWLCECTCPVMFDCKHAVATLCTAAETPAASWPQSRLAGIAAGERREPGWLAQHMAEVITQRRLQAPMTTARRKADGGQTEAIWDSWLKRLDQTRSGATEVAEPTRSFGLMLRADTGFDPPLLLAAPVWLRPAKTKRGGLVDPKPLLLEDHGPVPAPAEGWSAADLTSLAVLLQDAGYAQKVQYSEIVGTHHEQALLDLMQRHPVYFDTARDGEYNVGEPLSLVLEWITLDNGSQRLGVRVGAEEPTTLLRGASLWYVQPGSQRIGRILESPQWLEHVLSAPLLQAEQANTLRKRLSGKQAHALIPVPQERGKPRKLKGAPQPVLSLRLLELPWQSQQIRRTTQAACARLGFEYGGIRVPVDRLPTTRVFHDGQLWDIERDLTQEDARAMALRTFNLVNAQSYAYEQRMPQIPFDAADFLLQPDPQRPPQDAEAFSSLVAQLQDDGFRIEYAADFPRQTLVDIEAWHADLEESSNAWFDVSLGIDVDGKRVDLLPILSRLLDDPRFSLHPRPGEAENASLRVALDAERSADLPLSHLRALIGPLLEWLQAEHSEPIKLHRSAADQLQRSGEDHAVIWRGAEGLRERLDRARAAHRDGKEPEGFATTLRSYQREGLAWLGFLADSGLGGILADDMGLGKTVQVLAHLVDEKQRGHLASPALVVAPTSLVGNWQDEAARFAPMLDVLVLHGAERSDHFDAIGQHDVVITTYPLLPRDRDRLREAEFSLLILDEAQAIKNPRSQSARVVRELNAKRRLAMTGTPLENHLGELWAQFDAVEPGLLGSEKHFTRFYRTPIERHGDMDRQQRLKRRIGPLLLRRRKEDVLSELPAKTEVVQRLELQGAQRDLYETLRLAQHARVQDAVRDRGLGQSGIVVLDALLKLRQVCCDPRLVKLESARKVDESIKLDALLERLDSLIDEGRRVLVFSQFTSMLDLIAEALQARKMDYLMLTGQTPGGERGDLVRRFQAGDTPVFLISLKAGGTGLNLTAADAVIHYDPWWNPAVENQATDRAHRIGQDKSVLVYKLICAGTVEEKIQKMQARKSELARAVLEGGSSQRLSLDEADLAELFAPL